MRRLRNMPQNKRHPLGGAVEGQMSRMSCLNSSTSSKLR